MESKEDLEFVKLPSGYNVVMSSNIYENIFLNFNENQDFSFNNFINSGMYFPQIAAYINTIVSILKGYYEFTDIILINISSLVFFTVFWYMLKLYKVLGLSFFSCLIGGNVFRYFIHFIPVVIISLIFKQWKIFVSFAIVSLISAIARMILTAIFDKQKYNDSVAIYTYNLYSKKSSETFEEAPNCHIEKGSNQFLSDYAKEINSLSQGKVDSSEYSLSEQGDDTAPAKKYGNYNVYGKDIALEKPSPNNDIICPSCGAQLLKNAIFCNKCGTKYESKAKTDSKEAEKNFCRKCGEELFTDSEFCHKCGTKIIKKEVLK